MAARYWVGGSAAWNGTAGTKWATTSGGAGGSSVPTGSDDVFFDAASGAVTVTIAADRNLQSIDCTGFTGTLSFTAGAYLLYPVTAKFVAGMTLTNGGVLVGAPNNCALTCGGKTLYSLVLGSASSTCTMQDALQATTVDIQIGYLALKAGTTSTVSTLMTSGTNASRGLRSATPGSAATISDSSGSNSIDYITITDITATGGATWSYGANSTDGGGNTGWNLVTNSAPVMFIGECF